MALTTKRIIALPSQTDPQEGDYLAIDNAQDGTKKTPASVFAKAADLAAEQTARQQADEAEAQARQQTDAQVAGLKGDLDDKLSYLSKTTHSEDASTEIEFVNINKSINSSGNLSDQNGYNTTDFIDISDVYGIYRTGTMTKFALWTYAFYDENYNYISQEDTTTNYEIVDYDDIKVTWLNLAEGAKYIRIVADPSRPYTYYTVNRETIVDDYEVPPLVIGDVTEKKSNNLLDPSNFIQNGYYLNFSDGETQIANDYYKMTTDKIYTGLIDKLFVRQTFSTTSTNSFLVYCYSDDAYLGYVVNDFVSYGSNFTVKVKDGTTSIRIFSNVSDGSLSGNMICVSTEQLPNFEPYNPTIKIMEKALPILRTSVLANRNVVFLGDSIFGNNQSISGVANIFAKLTGANVSNFAFGGTQASLHTGTSPYALAWQKFDGISIASAIASGDFSDQESALQSSSMSEPAYFATSLAKLKSYDFSICDYIIADWGTNDWTSGASVNDYKNALEQIVQTILTAYPQIVFVEVTPFVRFFEDGGAFYNSSVYDYRHDGVYLKDFADAVSVLAEQPYNLQVVDCYNIGINDYTRTGFFSNNDWTHHDDRGRKRIATYLANKIC